MAKVKDYNNKPGPRKKDRLHKQCSVTFPPSVYDLLEGYMKENGLLNRSGTIAMLIETFLNSEAAK